MNAQKRIDKALGFIDVHVETLTYRQGVVTASSDFDTAELMLTTMLSIRADLVGGDYDYRGWLKGKYPDIPSSVRSITSYLNGKWEGRDPGFGPDAEEKNGNWIEEASEFVEYAMEEMSKMDEKIITEAKFYNPSIEYYVHAKPDKWISFLGEAMSEESQIILQEWFGYCLTNDTSLQKMLLLVGDRGTGKGTAIEVLRRLIQPGLHTRAAMSEMGKPFFLDSIRCKTAVFFDMAQSSTLRVLSNKLAKAAEGEDSMDDPDSVALSRLLRVSSEGAMRIERMGERAVTFKLDARFIIENGYDSEPEWPEEFEKRIVRVKFRESDKLKDTDILTDIFKEMPGILNWALEGLVRLRRAGRFTKLKNG